MAKPRSAMDADGLIANIDHRRWRIARESAVELTLTICRPSAGYLQSLSKVAHMEDPHIHREILAIEHTVGVVRSGRRVESQKHTLYSPAHDTSIPVNRSTSPVECPINCPSSRRAAGSSTSLAIATYPSTGTVAAQAPAAFKKQRGSVAMRVHARAGVPKQVAQVLALGRGEAQGGGGREVKPGEVAVAVAARGGADPGALAGALVHRDHLVEVAHGQVGPVAGLVDCGGVVTHLPEAAVVIPRLLRPA
eukprot:CAMPEP_0204358870 /NCGR_PEP_ID=MMETSP0469-20131031/36843_1 /ASSEMBLY_ACC=CAM_ASM_000384 /TAXON_ID=2969 /ORGANISM="Oxyrrhis marina" /LENGTH=249 /DNA_ID=CAMNT_0051346807 /DNA_START=19 /DNA_END=765 /DNA_ORIENTATION=+